MLNIILPSLPYERSVDPMWHDELAIAQRQGHTVCLFDAEQERLYRQPDPQRPTLYRGWMLTQEAYAKLAILTPLLVPVELYLASHQAPGWYDTVATFTPRSVFITPNTGRAKIEALLSQNGRFFVKGLSKSFGADSLISSLAEYDNLLVKHNVGGDEELFVREQITLSSEPEQRFFAVRDRVFGANGQVFPTALEPVLSVLRERGLYTIDVARDVSGQPLIIEIGDGQVSDTKEWTLSELYETVLPYLASVATKQSFTNQ